MKQFSALSIFTFNWVNFHYNFLQILYIHARIIEFVFVHEILKNFNLYP